MTVEKHAHESTCGGRVRGPSGLLREANVDQGRHAHHAGQGDLPGDFRTN